MAGIKYLKPPLHAPDDDALWTAATADVRRLKKEPRAPKSPRTVKKAAPGRKAPAAPVPAGTGTAPPRSREVDRRTAEKFRRGEMTIDARVDLHGMGQAGAHAALRDFVLRAYEDGRRCLLVITGKGRGGEGVLKRAVPAWLEEPSLDAIILKIQTARPRHGGDGALYVLLRRRRD